MKKITTQILLGLLAAATAWADTALPIIQPNGSCFYDSFLIQSPPSATGSFQLAGVSGTGTIHSGVAGAVGVLYPNIDVYSYYYSIDLSGMSLTANHCVKLVVHFGAPEVCGGPAIGGDPAQIQSATLAPFGDVTLVFTGGCLQPGQASVSFGMGSQTGWKTGFVTVIDDYTDPASGQTNEARINVQAIVPDIPPDPPPWAFAPPPIPNVFIQGYLNNVTNEIPMLTNRYATLPYDFRIQLFNAPSNGLAVSQVFTQTVQVANGLFNLPLPFDAINWGDASARWLSVGVRPSGSNVDFTPLNPPLPITPTPQALYALSAGTVADLAPGQAVTSLNGLSDAVNLQAGSGIILGTNGNTLTISAQPGVPSDRSIKTDFGSVNAQNILSRLATLPIEAWRYTNEIPGVRHVGPMAQDFKAAFGLGNNDKIIGFVDEEGVALAAIQGLNEKLEDRSQNSDARMKKLETENADLKQQLAELKQIVNHLNQKLNGGGR
jgi:Chaperone of endosialidase